MKDEYGSFVEPVVPNQEGLATLSQLAARLHQHEADVEKLEEQLREVKEKVRVLAQRDIPDMMEDLGVQEFVTSNGLKIKVKDQLRATPAADRRNEAWDWLEKHEHGALVKTQLTVSFGRNELVQAKALAEKLSRDFQNVGSERWVEPQTLKAWARERLEAGDEIPMDLFGVEQFREAKVEVKKV